MLNRAGYRLHIDGKSDHASWWVGPVVWCRWWIEWGPERTPVAHLYFNSCGSDVDFLIWTVWVRPVRYDWNQSKTLPLIPNDDSSVWSKRWWSIASNAALRSSRTSIAPPWVSTARRRSFWTRRRAVSVLCSWRYADWKTPDGELSDDPQAAHIQCVLQVWIRKKGSKQAESSLKFRNQVWPF